MSQIDTLQRTYGIHKRLTRSKANRLPSGFTPFKNKKISGQESPLLPIPGSFQEKTRIKGKKQDFIQPEVERVRPRDPEAVKFGERSTHKPEIAVNTPDRIGSPTTRNLIPTQNEDSVVTPDSRINRNELFLWLQMSHFAEKTQKNLVCLQEKLSRNSIFITLLSVLNLTPFHSPPTKNTRSQRNQAVPTPTARAPLDCIPSVHALSEDLDRGTPMKGGGPSRRGGPRSRLGEAEDGEGEESVEEEGSTENEVAAALAGAPEASETPNLAIFNQPLVSKAEPNFLKMMEKMTKFMGQLTKAVSPRESSRAQAFKTPSMKAPYSFDGSEVHKMRGFIQSCQLIFYNDPENFFSDRQKVLYSTSFLTGRAEKWIESYLSNISNEYPSYLLKNWQLFETQLFTLFSDPNEVRKDEQELVI
ncbi:hypothetical protein O181_031966 [Austropuccinia psidii MF-1]|uniref:DUF4939 domain-containing protein n=1 Tax=Austropuccinia psidii MF-1 TaxID=1389203 RepID=A0A9Q3H5Q3_9BASI|nr:hypothetical protein [Austropuccinia psidii MF-1]